MTAGGEAREPAPHQVPSCRPADAAARAQPRSDRRDAAARVLLPEVSVRWPENLRNMDKQCDSEMSPFPTVSLMGALLYMTYVLL